MKIIKGYGLGKGAAIKLGSKNCNGVIIFYLDVDLSTDLSNIKLFIDKIKNDKFDIVIGTRQLRLQGRSIIRFFISLWLLIIQRMFVFNSNFFYDTQCGFKAFKKESFLKLTDRQLIDGGMFDIELLYIAKKLNLKILSIEVVPTNNTKSRINILRCLYRDPVDLLRIKINGLAKKYN